MPFLREPENQKARLEKLFPSSCDAAAPQGWEAWDLLKKNQSLSSSVLSVPLMNTRNTLPLSKSLERGNLFFLPILFPNLL